MTAEDGHDRRASPQCEAATGALVVERDADAAFAAAIRAGLLSAAPDADNWAGHYLYMFHGGDGRARFKHRDTRAYVTMPPDPAEGPS